MTKSCRTHRAIDPKSCRTWEVPRGHSLEQPACSACRNAQTNRKSWVRSNMVNTPWDWHMMPTLTTQKYVILIFVPNSFLLLVGRPGAPSSVLAPFVAMPFAPNVVSIAGSLHLPVPVPPSDCSDAPVPPAPNPDGSLAGDRSGCHRRRVLTWNVSINSKPTPNTFSERTWRPMGLGNVTNVLKASFKRQCLYHCLYALRHSTLREGEWRLLDVGFFAGVSGGFARLSHSFGGSNMVQSPSQRACGSLSGCNGS